MMIHESVMRVKNSELYYYLINKMLIEINQSSDVNITLEHLENNGYYFEKFIKVTDDKGRKYKFTIFPPKRNKHFKVSYVLGTTSVLYEYEISFLTEKTCLVRYSEDVVTGSKLQKIVNRILSPFKKKRIVKSIEANLNEIEAKINSNTTYSI